MLSFVSILVKALVSGCQENIISVQVIVKDESDSVKGLCVKLF